MSAQYDYYGGEKRYKKWPSKSEYRILQRLEEGEALLRCLVCNKRLWHLSNQKRKSKLSKLDVERKKLPYCNEHLEESPYVKEVMARIAAEEGYTSTGLPIGRLLEFLKAGQSLARACSNLKCDVLEAKKELEALGYEFFETHATKQKDRKFYWLKQRKMANPMKRRKNNGRPKRRPSGEGKRCLVCDQPAGNERYGEVKAPYCLKHIDQSPYIKDYLLPSMAVQARREEEVKKKLALGQIVDSNEQLVQDVLDYLEVGNSLKKIAKIFGLSDRQQLALQRTLEAAGYKFVTSKSKKYGHPVVQLVGRQVLNKPGKRANPYVYTGGISYADMWQKPKTPAVVGYPKGVTAASFNAVGSELVPSTSELMRKNPKTKIRLCKRCRCVIKSKKGPGRPPKYCKRCR